MMGRQCLAPNTLLLTKNGYTPIKDVEVGDLVLSKNSEWKPIINKWEYGVDTDPKPMLHYRIDGQEIKSTYDHKFYYNGEFVEIYKLAWGTMAASQRLQLKLLCKQYGTPFDDQQAQQKGLDSGDEASTRRQRVSTDSDGQKDGESTSSSSSNLATESTKQTDSKSYRQQPSQQSDNQSGVGNVKGKYTAFSQTRQSRQQAGQELRNPQTKRESSARDTGKQPAKKRVSQEVRGITVYDWGDNKTGELVSHITVHPCELTYSIDVADYHCYTITKSNILVANSGKTYWATNHAWLSAVIEQGRYFVVFKTYKQAHEVVWRQYVPLIPKELVYKKNEADLLIELNYIRAPVVLPDGTNLRVEHDDTKPRSTIQLLGSDQADTHRGFKANGIIFDEYADQSPDNWDAVYKHFFTTTDGWACFMGTPRGYNHFYDLVQYSKEDERWYYQEATWRDSPYVKKEFIEQEREEARKKGTLSTFLQEVELEFRSIQGAVFPNFSRKVHVVQHKDIPDTLTYYGAIDFGYHTTAFLLIGIDRDQNWWVVDEVYGKQETLNDVIPRIKNVVGDKRLVLVIGDSADRDAIEVMRKDFPIKGADKGGGTAAITTGIQLIRNKLKPRTQLVGPPKPQLFLSSNCKNLVIEMESYKYPEEKKDRNPSELPVKSDDHGPDALRYLMLELKHGLQKDDPLPKPSLQFNSYGLL